MEIEIINHSNNPLPIHKTVGAAGLDLQAFLENPVTLVPLQRELIPTGLFVAIPKGYEAQIRPRSGMAFKHGITLPNSPATIDSDYRGELKIPVINLSNESFVINSGDRIAQMVVARHETVEWKAVEQLHETQRGVGGLGHTGK